MFYSHCLLSRNGPLGAIWVAAYFFKKLKRSQVTRIDISSSVDRILQDEFDVVTYRVLAYLLLGVVRVFSKKVDYLFNDCNKVLLKIRDFVATNKDNPQLDTLCAPCISIAVPERFELDAFDLETLDDAIAGHALPNEDITLKESTLKTGTAVLHASDEHLCEELATCDVFSAPHNLNKKFNVRAGTSCNFSNLELGEKKHQGDCSYLPESVSLDKLHEEPTMQELWGKSICEDALLNLQIFSGVGQKDNNPAKLSSELNQTNPESTEVDGARIQVENHQIMEEDCNNINDQIMEHCNLTIPEEASMDKLRDNIVSRDECRDAEMFDIAEPPEYTEEHQNTEREKLLEAEEPAKNTMSFGDKHQTDVEHKSSSDATPGNIMSKIFTEDNPLSVAVDSTPKSKFPYASGASTPEFLGIPTPVAKERSRVSRKRKCLFDDVIVFPNNVVKRCIEDSTDLVCERKKAPRTALAAWRAYQASNLPHCFFEPLIPYTSSELTSLFSQKKCNVLASLHIERHGGKSVSGYPTASSSAENAESAQELDNSKACDAGRVGETMNSLDGSNVLSFRAVDPPENVDIPESPSGGRPLEQSAIAPETPVQHTKSLRPFESPERPQISDMDRVGLESGGAGEDPSPVKQYDFDVGSIDEDTNSIQGDNQDQNGLTSRTRVVMRYLDKCFLNRRKQREKEVVNLMPLLEGTTKKKSAILFYETLVLKSKGYVDVKQETAYKEILVWKSSYWGQSYTG